MYILLNIHGNSKKECIFILQFIAAKNCINLSCCKKLFPVMLSCNRLCITGKRQKQKRKTPS